MDTQNYIAKKYNLRFGGHDWIVEIPNMGRGQLAELFSELNFNVGAEIGVDRGKYSEVLCRANPNLHLYSIDPWLNSVYEANVPERTNYDQNYLEGRLQQALKRLEPYNCTIIKKTSMDALDDFEDETLDFVYIDGNHNFPNVTNDLHYWSTKVRKGGIVSGHDYAYFSSSRNNHVKHAVIAYTKAYGIKPHFVVGTSHEAGTRDLIRSWFWVKQ